MTTKLAVILACGLGPYLCLALAQAGTGAPEGFLLDVARQVPALIVLAFVVRIMLQHLADKERRENERAGARNERFAATLTELVDRFRRDSDEAKALNDHAHQELQALREVVTRVERRLEVHLHVSDLEREALEEGDGE